VTGVGGEGDEAAGADERAGRDELGGLGDALAAACAAAASAGGCVRRHGSIVPRPIVSGLAVT
jgi:hypothetical protein